MQQFERLFGIHSVDLLRRSLDVGEQHRYLLAFTLQCTLRAQYSLRQMFRNVATWRQRVRAGGSRRQARATSVAKTGSCRHRRLARFAHRHDRSAARCAKAGTVSICRAAVQTQHRVRSPSCQLEPQSMVDHVIDEKSVRANVCQPPAGRRCRVTAPGASALYSSSTELLSIACVQRSKSGSAASTRMSVVSCLAADMEESRCGP